MEEGPKLIKCYLQPHVEDGLREVGLRGICLYGTGLRGQLFEPNLFSQWICKAGTWHEQVRRSCSSSPSLDHTELGV